MGNHEQFSCKENGIKCNELYMNVNAVNASQNTRGISYAVFGRNIKDN